jgi:5-methylcytosine-specific restriction endonuclease McrA
MTEDVPPPVPTSEQTNYALRDTEPQRHTDLGGAETDTEFGHTAYIREQDRIESESCIICGRPAPAEAGKTICSDECEHTFNSIRLLDKYAPTPKRYECDWCGRIFKGKESYEKQFCSEDCRAEWYSETFSGEGNPQWEGGTEDYYGSDWHRQRKRAIDRDGGQCQSCGVSMEEHTEKHGRGLHVHHITPLRKYEDKEQANQLENLITLCQACHGEHEGDSKEEILNNGS